MPAKRKSIDRRVARTRAMLHEALTALVMEKGYEAITVEDICSRANVGRSTFYCHYTNKDDLMRGGFKHLRDDLLDRPSGAETFQNEALAFSLAVFEHARDHTNIHRTLAGGRGGTIAFEMVRETLGDLVRGELKPASDEGARDSVPRELVVQYLVGAFMGVLAWWLDGGV